MALGQQPVVQKVDPGSPFQPAGPGGPAAWWQELTPPERRTFWACFVFSGMGAFFTELFPTRIRGSGQGFSYNFGRGIGALFPSWSAT